ncbi:AraC family transcriptional regulator [Rhizobiaceae bacterium n13]|uniref:AraC family transcriptional regulator n=1 Tax=Ferirhizobium litorale TaxID=2927786 RepID=A0AAE3QFA5_9HYPH|nr:AraC family transcriptional regulator [Fererhizobium litorale]MDI7864497.1 AraC family transcriptional regulator [Fererhizobium litorale]MDI7924752.1 AraC family transcriptional regulator [Fererhizobium litorale]
MTFTASQGDRKYRTSERVGELVECPSLQVELRNFDPGWQVDLTLECTEIAVLLSGQAKIRWTGDGQRQETIARPGIAWVCPAGVHESDVEIVGTMPDSLHIFLPPSLIGESALSNFDIDPARVQLAYAGGVPDPTVLQIGQLFRGLLNRKLEPTDRLFLDGIQMALAAHLLATYSSARWRPSERKTTIAPQRLQRVFDFIEARIAADIALDDLAAEACLSPYHFSRMFRQATGLTPHRYVTERRIEAAKEKLRFARHSLVEIALDTGFGSQANFTRVFHKMTGLTPGQYRALVTL